MAHKLSAELDDSDEDIAGTEEETETHDPFWSLVQEKRNEVIEAIAARTDEMTESDMTLVDELAADSQRQIDAAMAALVDKLYLQNPPIKTWNISHLIVKAFCKEMPYAVHTGENKDGTEAVVAYQSWENAGILYAKDFDTMHEWKAVGIGGGFLLPEKYRNNVVITKLCTQNTPFPTDPEFPLNSPSAWQLYMNKLETLSEGRMQIAFESWGQRDIPDPLLHGPEKYAEHVIDPFSEEKRDSRYKTRKMLAVDDPLLDVTDSKCAKSGVE